MANDKTDRLLNQIGQILADDKEYPLDETLLYAKVRDGFCSPAIFKSRGNHIVYRDPDLNTICDPLMSLWDEAEPGKQWAEMEYLIRDGRFTLTYTYPEEIDPKEDSFERRDRIVARHFGDKPTVYPPWDDDVQQFEL